MEHMIRILQAFGGQFEERRGWLCGHASLNIMHFSDSRSLLTGPLVSGATKTAILGALGVREGGHSTVLHPYTKPDVTQLLAFLRTQGASVIDEENGFRLSAKSGTADLDSASFTLISDLSEIITFIALAVVMRVPLRIDGVTTNHVRPGLAAELELLERMGVELAWTEDYLLVFPPERISSVDIEVTSVGIYSDHQPFFALMLLCGDGPARIQERVWASRFAYARELIKLGAQIEIGDGEILIYPSRLRQFEGTLVATDLRGAAALVIAACMVAAPVTVAGLNHLQRGYSSLLSTIAALGVSSYSA
jgi:UDP-N-acetylglucosamine 1-carboxyvinyltransferase